MYGNLLGLFILSADLCTRINKNSSAHDWKKISCIPYGTYLLDMTHQDFGAVLFWAGSGSRTHIVKIILDLLKVTYLLYSLYSLRGSLKFTKNWSRSRTKSDLSGSCQIPWFRAALASKPCGTQNICFPFFFLFTLFSIMLERELPGGSQRILVRDNRWVSPTPNCFSWPRPPTGRSWRTSWWACSRSSPRQDTRARVFHS